MSYEENYEEDLRLPYTKEVVDGAGVESFGGKRDHFVFAPWSLFLVWKDDFTFMKGIGTDKGRFGKLIDFSRLKKHFNVILEKSFIEKSVDSVFNNME